MSVDVVTGPHTRIRLRPGVSATTLPDGRRRLFAWPHALTLPAAGPGVEALLGRLIAGGDGDRQILEDVAGEHGRPAADAAAVVLGRLHAQGWITRTEYDGPRAVYSVQPLRAPDTPPVDGAVKEPGTEGLLLSRFVVVRRDGDALLVESPLSWCEVRLHDPAALGAVMSGLPGDGAVAGESGADPDQASVLPQDDPWVLRLRRDLLAAGMLVDPRTEEDQLRTCQWGPHELWFHDRSRLAYRGALGEGFGGTWWGRDRFDPPPARPRPYPGPAVDLPRPDLERLRAEDTPFTAVMEDRRSLRVHDASAPITAEQLGHFLYRTARTRRSAVRDGFEFTSRPYTSGGSVYEVELYPVVTAVEGLAAGMYHYDSHEHRLRLVVGADTPPVRRMLRVAAQASTTNVAPQVLILLSARVGRVMWKYEGMGYSLILKNVGALYQSMNLVATAMGLAACALGAEDGAAFTEATGRDPLEECSVGHFMLGSVGQP
jgi:SagB-type dehydrogenase family enzyme